MPGKHDIYIITAGGEFRVRPAVTMVEGSGGGGARQLKIRNVTEHAVFLCFPPNFILGQEIITLAGKGKTSVTLAPNLDGIYEYTAVVSKNGELMAAKGESGPSVIVDL